MTMTGEQIRLPGLVRFLQHFEEGNGDCTAERSDLLSGLTMEMMRQRSAARGKAGASISRCVCTFGAWGIPLPSCAARIGSTRCRLVRIDCGQG